MGAEGEEFGGEARTAFGDRAFEIGDAVVGCLEHGGEGCQWVAALGDEAPRTVVEHDVAGENQGHRFSLDAGRPK